MRNGLTSDTLTFVTYYKRREGHKQEREQMDLTKPDKPPPQHHASSVFASLHRKPRPDADLASKAAETREEAIKSAKRYLLETIRDDWSYEDQSATSPPESESQHLQSQPQSPLICPTLDGAVQLHAREVREWREREQDSSCSETGGVGVTFKEIDPGLVHPLSATYKVSDPYRFESPDAVEDSILERKRKRRRVVEEEMAWNEGLRIWMERRNAWTGARLPTTAADSQRNGTVVGTTGSNETSGSGSRRYGENEDAEMVSPDSTGQGDGPLRPPSASSASAPQGADAQILSPSDLIGDMDIREAVSTINADDNPNPNSSQPRVQHSGEPLIPVVEPLLPITNVVRASIKPSIYPSIYSKVVIQSLTPAIPINLSDVTKALVQGWKADDEWPPKPTITQDVPVVKKRAGGNKPPTTEDEGKSRRLSGSGVTGAVKKVLGLSGIHTGRRFHIRGGSHGDAVTAAGALSPTASGAAPNELGEAR
ncbi:conserved hypothetical protein [Histoplasma capsulatum H143]|uniref:Gag1-like clamp domain-containing protein n=1 Tax=Ajellomyces capsulatus (strain H143) TaxID=544712 RepID=C6HJQ4_AJECH|nr:conserved hypothetical protein [Histoplasma capsulatum H143]